jgi:MFS transporter, DHA1 family, solute carrier family 18 (vesicular amine transporter), member 1/2
LSGWFADNNGTEWVATLCIGCALPWWIVISVRLPIWLFVTAFAFESRSSATIQNICVNHGFAGFFSSGLNSIVSAELAAVARDNEGIGCKSSIWLQLAIKIKTDPQTLTLMALSTSRMGLATQVI